MPFGILDDHKLDTVPGTGLISVKDDHLATYEARELKRGTGKYSHIVLIPQPSDDPRDPLNWPPLKKEACFWTLVFAAIISEVLSSSASPAYVLLAKEFHVSVDDVTSCFSAGDLGLATFALVQNPLAFKYGHRIIYLLSTLLMFTTCIWTALSPNLTSIRASRVFQGFGRRAPQCLLGATIEQLFFVHERGFRASAWYFARMGSSALGSVIGGYIIQNLSWQLLFWLASIACGLALVGVFFFVPETTYLRQPSPISFTPTKNEDAADKDKALSPNAPTTGILSQIKIYSGTFSDESLWKSFLKQFIFVLSPVTWFVFVDFLLPALWQNLVSICSSTIFTVTYGFTAAQIGLTQLGGFVGAVLAMLITGPLNDRCIVWVSQRNHGVYEPEFRLFFMLSMLFGVFGYVGWAIGNDNHMPWIGAVACYMTIHFSVVISGGAAVGYLLDTHGTRSLHVLSITHFAEDMVSYASTFFANGFVLAHGVKHSLLILGGCQAACWLAAVAMYVCGKRARSFIARHPALFSGDVPTSESGSCQCCSQSAASAGPGTPNSKS
ncbi:MFS general substrate transporter [Ganoderma sinense ZZ0214-1]|uniref:MFS general substrate transporter n=1 Tax=Ganoderma sinense ZZ0214-1 TaxID=1077348 RepID=A0A2G8SBV3_9APHY|nr:MFS general substrate transporter [Ganoderma sinense ZZ0214-1]